MQVRRGLVAGVLVALLASCSGSGDSDNAGPSSARSEPSSTSTTEATTTTTAPPSPESLVAEFTAAGLPISTSVVFTAETDPNDNLARPGQYTGKVSWVDERLRDDCLAVAA